MPPQAGCCRGSSGRTAVSRGSSLLDLPVDHHLVATRSVQFTPSRRVKSILNGAEAVLSGLDRSWAACARSLVGGPHELRRELSWRARRMTVAERRSVPVG
jgi:hypothetical protein